MVLCQPFAKRQKVSKQFLCEYQIFIELTICSNMFGIQRNSHFLVKFRKMILALMELEQRLVIIFTLIVLLLPPAVRSQMIVQYYLVSLVLVFMQIRFGSEKGSQHVSNFLSAMTSKLLPLIQMNLQKLPMISIVLSPCVLSKQVKSQ